MIRIWLLWGFLLITVFNSDAQSNLRFTDPHKVDSITWENDDLLIKFDVASVLVERLLVSAEFFLKPSRISLNTDLGYLYSTEYSENQQVSFFGYTISPQLRYYVFTSKKRPSRWFMGMSGRYKYGRSRGNQTIGIDCDDSGNCGFLRAYKGEVLVEGYNAQLHVGNQRKIKEDLYIEADVGLGYGHESQKLEGYDISDVILYNSNMHMRPSDRGWGLTGAFYLRLVFVLDGKKKRPKSSQ